jgi:hypothetical protein
LRSNPVPTVASLHSLRAGGSDTDWDELGEGAALLDSISKWDVASES